MKGTPAPERNLFQEQPSTAQQNNITAAPADLPSRAARETCLCCMGRHRAHTCGLGGRRGRPKGSTCNKRQHGNTTPKSTGAKESAVMPPPGMQRLLNSRRNLEAQRLPSSHPPHSNLHPLPSRLMLPPGTSAISEVASGPSQGVRCLTTASFAAELLAHYDSVRNALSSDAESRSSSARVPHGSHFTGPFDALPQEQHLPHHLMPDEPAAPPYLMRFAMTLFYVHTILRMGTGICASLEFGPPSSIAQPPTLKVSLSEAERNLQELVRAHIHGAPGWKLLQSVRDTLSVGSLILVPDAVPETSSSSSGSTSGSSSTSSETAGLNSPSSSSPSPSPPSLSAASLHEQRMEALRGAVWQPCTTCAPFACQMRGAPSHAAVPTAVAVHLRVLHHFRCLTHEALLRSTVSTVAHASKRSRQENHQQQQQQQQQQKHSHRQASFPLPHLPPPRQLTPPPHLPSPSLSQPPSASLSHRGPPDLGGGRHFSPFELLAKPPPTPTAATGETQHSSVTAASSPLSVLAPKQMPNEMSNEEAAAAVAMTAAVAAMAGIDSGLPWNHAPSSTVSSSPSTSAPSCSSSTSPSSSTSAASCSTSMSSNPPNSSTPSSFSSSISSDALSRSGSSDYTSDGEEIRQRLQAVQNASAAYSLTSGYSFGAAMLDNGASSSPNHDGMLPNRAHKKAKNSSSSAAAAVAAASLSAAPPPVVDKCQFDGDKHCKKSQLPSRTTEDEEAECAQVLSCLRGQPE